MLKCREGHRDASTAKDSASLDIRRPGGMVPTVIARPSGVITVRSFTGDELSLRAVTRITTVAVPPSTVAR
jgi:hypothetical protein